MRDASTRFAFWIKPSGSDASICLISDITATGFGGGLLTLEVAGGELLFTLRVSDPLLAPQIAACVRFWTRILRRIALTCTFTVASAMSIFRAMHLLESPLIRQRRTDSSRKESCGASASSVVTRIALLLSSPGTASQRCSLSGSRTNDRYASGKIVSPIITNSKDLMNAAHVISTK